MANLLIELSSGPLSPFGLVQSYVLIFSSFVSCSYNNWNQ